MDPSSGGIGESKTSGPERGTEDRGTGRIESGGEINLMDLGTNLMANTNEDFPVDIGAAAITSWGLKAPASLRSLWLFTTSKSPSKYSNRF